MNPVTPRRQLPGWRRLLFLVVGGFFVLLLIWAAWRTWTAYSAYRAVIADIVALQAVVGEGIGTLSVDTIAGIEPKIDDLSRDLRRLEEATAIPLGGEALVSQLPWIGPRYTTGRAAIRMAGLLADAGKSVTGIAREVLVAFQSTGARLPSPPAAATWLDVFGRHQAELEQITKTIDEANALRAGIDERLLPAEVRAQLDSLDQILKRFDLNRLNRLLGANIPALRAALGGDWLVRYLVLFQNPAELHQSGGFPGTIALIGKEIIERLTTVDRGTLLETIKPLGAEAARREIRLYAADPAVQL